MNRHIVFFAIYELSDLNRDEGVGNVQTLKKLTRYNGLYTFVSKYSFRHHLFNTLREAYGWKPAEVQAEGDVIQFDLSREDILSSPELDAFGYMYTISGENAITRKSPVAITKLVSFEPFMGDTAFYANHDLVKRALSIGNSATPNPYGREEHMALYRGGVVINTNKLGVDEWILDKPFYIDDENNVLILFLKVETRIDNKNKTIALSIRKKDKDNGGDEKSKYKDLVKRKLTNTNSESVEKLIGEMIVELYDKCKSGREKPESLGLKEVKFIDSEDLNGSLKDNAYFCPSVYEGLKILKVKNGEIIIGRFRDSRNKYKLLFLLNPEEKKKRIKDLVYALTSGISFQVGGEGWALTPIFYVVALSRAPIQFLFPHIGLDFSKKPPEVVGLRYALENPYCEKYHLFHNESKLSCTPPEKKRVSSLEELLRELGIENSDRR